jgi:hypothetical protein
VSLALELPDRAAGGAEAPGDAGRYGLLCAVCAALALLVMPLALLHEDRAGWTVLLLTYAVLLGARPLRGRGRLALAACGVLTVYHAVALANAYVRTMPGADVDAALFHRDAVDLAGGGGFEWSLDIGSIFYLQFLAFFYRAFGASHLLGEELTILAFVLGCITFLRLADALGLHRYRRGLLLLAALLPSCVLFQAVTLREAWQAWLSLACVAAAFGVRWRPGLGSIARLLAACVALGFWHNGLAVYALFVLVAGLYWALGARGRPAAGLWRAGGLMLGVAVAAVFLGLLRDSGTAGGALASGEALEYAESYRLSGKAESRARYGVMLDSSSPAGLATTLPVVFIQYMFAPFPWQVGNAMDLEALGESAVRFALLWFAFAAWRRARGEHRAALGFVLLMFMVMEFLWSLGTINWGTAIRHHVVGWGMLVLAGGPGLLDGLGASLRRLLGVSPPGRALPASPEEVPQIYRYEA